MAVMRVAPGPSHPGLFLGHPRPVLVPHARPAHPWCQAPIGRARCACDPHRRMAHPLVCWSISALISHHQP
ncbi:MAG: hypothetical protein ACJ8BW_25460 [Ktedonobacteraceae bacterium]